jgi:phospholipid/cholesterol/gamma-HCH transport system substrate-binding protein
MAKDQIKVGVFVLVGLGLLTGIIFLIGEDAHLWQSKMSFTAPFKDVQGLKTGGPVRLGGVDIGTVDSVAYDGKAANDTRIFVKLLIVKAEGQRVRIGSVAHIANKGLLGDKMVEITVPDPSAPPAPDKSELKTEESGDIMAQVNDLSAQVKRTLDNIENATRGFGDPRFGDDVRKSAEDLRIILDGIARSDGAMHRLFLDPREGERLDHTIDNVNVSLTRLSTLLGEASAVTEQVRAGPGIAHALVYDGDLSKNAAGTVDEIHRDLVAIREGNGVAHALVYGDDQTQHVMGNLTKMTADLSAIVADVRAGKGTIGGLLVDPSVYEDLKSAVGNVERNQVLRALVRYSIKEDESRPHADPQVTVAKP